MAKPNSWKPGQSGNPKGAPKRSWTWSGELEKAVEKANLEGRRIKEVIAESLIAEALKGNVNAHKAIMDRMDGMPKQDITSDGEKLESIQVIIVEDKQNDSE